MNTLESIAEALRMGRKDPTDVELAAKTGMARQSVSRALSGTSNFTVNTLLALAEVNDLVVLVVPRAVAGALSGANAALGYAESLEGR